MSKKLGFFHLVQYSPWPLFCSLSVLNLMISFISWFNEIGNVTLLTSLAVLTVLSGLWWRDTERESSMTGAHSFVVKKGLKIGMFLFILSEVMFFVSFFWAFIHSSSVSDFEVGGNWPPVQIFPFNPMGVPLVNTIVLLSSGASVTWCHHSMINGFLKESKFSLFLTIFLGMFFTFLQGIEYMSSSFSLVDGVVGSTFFMSTGFHGFHVLVGSTFLFIVYIKTSMMLNTNSQNVGFECSAWYWHFVDVVWLFLYSLVYWWGG